MLTVKFELLLGSSAALSGLCVDAGGLDLVVTVDTDDLLSDILHAGKVVSEGGNGDGVALYATFKALKHALHIVVIELDTEELVYLFNVKRKLYSLRLGGVNVDNAVNHVTCTEKLNKLTSSEKSCHAVFGVKTLLKARRGFGSHTVLLCGNANRGAREAS